MTTLSQQKGFQGVVSRLLLIHVILFETYTKQAILRCINMFLKDVFQSLLRVVSNFPRLLNSNDLICDLGLCQKKGLVFDECARKYYNSSRKFWDQISNTWSVSVASISDCHPCRKCIQRIKIAFLSLSLAMSALKSQKEFGSIPRAWHLFNIPCRGLKEYIWSRC